MTGTGAVEAAIYSFAQEDPEAAPARLRPATLDDVVEVATWVSEERDRFGRVDFSGWQRSRRKKARRVAHAITRVGNLPRPANDAAAAVVLDAFDEVLASRGSFAANNRRLASAVGDVAPVSSL